jgi:hypothetical protein
VTVTTIIRPLTALLLGTKIVAYQTAYDALGSQCDPSYTLQGGNPGDSTAQEEELAISAYLLAGFTVTVPDYEGTSLDWGAGQEAGYGWATPTEPATGSWSTGTSRRWPISTAGAGCPSPIPCTRCCPTAMRPYREAQALTFLEGLFNGHAAPSGCASIGQGNSLAPLPQPSS